MDEAPQALTIYQYGPHPLLGDGILDHKFLWYLQVLCAAIFHHMPHSGLLMHVLSMKMATIKRNKKRRQFLFLHFP
jgi:hypothetical protein